ncbi:MAG TPA: hypothetical protein VGX48_17835 [Pyrinomonadaceae bacterium]|jgi:mRNA-degrading endonuclease RelE of RelBE toxin-antitoxin system|nr:hypothetical protein [Pyrinomonadaceae bacterium]
MKKVSAKSSSADHEMTTLRLAKPVKRELKRLAKKEHRSLSSYVSLLLENHAREVGELKPQEG